MGCLFVSKIGKLAKPRVASNYYVRLHLCQHANRVNFFLGNIVSNVLVSPSSYLLHFLYQCASRILWRNALLRYQNVPYYPTCMICITKAFC